MWDRFQEISFLEKTRSEKLSWGVRNDKEIKQISKGNFLLLVLILRSLPLYRMDSVPFENFSTKRYIHTNSKNLQVYPTHIDATKPANFNFNQSNEFEPSDQ